MANQAPRLVLILLALLMPACASLPEGSQRVEEDPWERYNRSMFAFNDAIDKTVLRPVAKGYRFVTPDPVERGVSNFFDNLAYPAVILNQFLQGNFGNGARDIGRFLFNSTVGIGGIFDPATSIGLERHNEDFGQTLGAWGVPGGPYVVLPLFGPSTVRDGIGTYADSQANILWSEIDKPEQYYLIALRVIDLRAQLLDLDQQLESTYDPYAFMRDAYLQRREYLVHDGNLPQDPDYYDDIYEDFEDFEDFEDDAPADAGDDTPDAAGDPADDNKQPGEDDAGNENTGG